MFILSCGRSSLSASDVERDNTEHSARDAAAVAPLDRRRGSGGDDSWAGSRSDRTDGEPPLAFGQLDRSMSNYDSMATRLKTASRSDFPSLWSSVRDTIAKHRQTLSATSVDGDQVPIPELHVGHYQHFCQPQTWSSVFASPGDFTMRVDSANERDGEIVFRIAVVCRSIRAVKDGAAVASTEATKRKSFVKFVVRTEQELVRFSETMALKYLGHRLTDKLPKLVLSVLSSSQAQLDTHADAMTSYLSYVLSITEIGHNRLLVLTEAVPKNLIVREFFDLSLGFGDPNMVSTSSCDARLERCAAVDRPLLPSAWFDVMGSAHSKSFTLPRRVESPQNEGTFRSSSSRLSDSGYEFKSTGMRSPISTTMNSDEVSHGKCIQFIRPSRWHQEGPTEGAFTTEIVGVTVSEGRAKYTICVLCYVRGKLEISTVDRRFSEFDSMVNRIDSKLRALSVRNHFPTKTLFRSLSVGYLERRAAHLQRFLEKLLQMRFLGVLDQEISMVAEPNVRKFLSLPNVQWSVTPWRIARSPRMHYAAARIERYAASPSARADSSPMYMRTLTPNSNGSLSSATYEAASPSTLQYYNFNRRRSGSL